MGLPCAEGTGLVIMAEISVSVPLCIHTWSLRVRDHFQWTGLRMGKQGYRQSSPAKTCFPNPYLK